MIVDFSHLTSKISVPSLHLPLFTNVLRAVPIPTGLSAIRVDLQHAFYSVPLHPSVRFLTTFLVGKTRYAFNRLPMGLSSSPSCLPFLLQEALAPLRRAVFISWIHVDDLLIVDTPQRLAVIKPLLLSLLSSWNFVINAKKSQLQPSPLVEYLGLSLNFSTRVYAPLPCHIAAFFQFSRSVQSNSPPKLLERYFGHAAFLLSISIRLYPFFPSCPTSLTRLLAIVYKHTRFRMPMRVPQPRTVLVAADATPSAVAFINLRTGLTWAAPRVAFQTHNELYALLTAVLYFRRTATYLTDSAACLTLCKRSTYLLPLKIAVALISPQILWVPSASNPADFPSRSGRFGLYVLPIPRGVRLNSTNISARRHTIGRA